MRKTCTALLAVLLAGTMLLALHACGKTEPEEPTSAVFASVIEKSVTATEVPTEITSETAAETATETTAASAATTVSATTTATATTAPGTTTTKPATTTAAAAATVSNGDYSLNSTDKAAVIALYKKAAAANEKSKFSYGMELDGKLDGTGGVAKLISMFSGVINKTLAKQSDTMDGFPGDPKAITNSDITSASAKDNGNGTTTIKLNVKQQTDGLNGKQHEGPVGHVISVLDGVQVALDQLADNGLKVKVNGSATLLYSGATAEITIDNKTGLVQDGKWRLPISISIKDATAASIIHLDELHGKIKYHVDDK